MDYRLVVFLLGVFFAILPLCFLFFFKDMKKVRIAFVVLFVLYCIILFFGVFAKVGIGKKITVSFYTIEKGARRAFNYMIYTFSLRDVIINITMFVPFGFFVCSFFKEYGTLKTAGIGLVTSIFIEAVQYFLPGVRMSQMSDILLNTTSTFIGAVAFAVLLLIKKKIFKNKWSN